MRTEEPKTIFFVPPDLRKAGSITCKSCKIISYKQKDYKLLHEAQKLSYWIDKEQTVEGPYCHFCIGEVVLEGDEEITVKIKYEHDSDRTGD